MRIIAGEHRGRPLLGPDGSETTRPITDRVKQSLFDRLWAMGVFGDDGLEPGPDPGEDLVIDPREELAAIEAQEEEGVQEVQEAEEATTSDGSDKPATETEADSPQDAPRVLDIFSGTGSLGLEALSRGGRSCVFIERDRVGRERLTENIRTIGLDDRARVRAIDALSPGWWEALGERDFGLILLDPPYRMIEDAAIAGRVGGVMNGLRSIAADGCVMMLRTPSGHTPPGVDAARWDGPDSYRYGGMTLHFYEARTPLS